MFSRKKILVVEDNIANRLTLCKILSQDYETLEAANGQEALDLLSREDQDVSLIFLDIQMPVMDGYTFLQKLQTDRILSAIPVIVATQSDGEEDEVDNADTQLALQNNVKAQYQQQIIDLLSPVFGKENVIAQVNVTLNFDKTKSESIEYAAPEGREEGLVTSMRELVEAIKNDGAGGIPGIDSNGNASQYLASLDTSDAVYYNVSREVNYEINQTTTQIEQAQGQVKDISVSVVLNSENTGNYADEVTQLVSTATGAKPENITVKALPFAEADTSLPEMATSLEVQQKIISDAQSAETTRLIILVIGGIIVAIFLFSIIKMLIPKKEEEMQEAEGFELIADEEIIPGAEPVSDIDAKEIDFEAKDDNLAVLKDYVNKNPESIANMLRNWLNED